MDHAIGFLRNCSTYYLIDTLGFEKHMRQVRKRRGDEVPEAWYERPYAYGLRLERDKILGDGDEIIIPPIVKKADYEFELVGYFHEDFKTSDVREAIAFVRENMFFTIMNDMSARDLQRDDMRLPLWVGSSKSVIAKSFGPMWMYGSSLLLDENGVPNIAMRLFVNGEKRCDDNFNSIYFTQPKSQEKTCWGFAQTIAWFGRERDTGFQRGDLLGSGTIGNGSIAELSHKYPWLKDGDVVRMEVDGIGVLENIIRVKGAGQGDVH